MNSEKPSLLLPRRRVLADGARLIGTLSLGSVAGIVADGCARQPKDSTSLNARFLHVTFTVAGEIAAATSAAPYFYLAVINLTNNQSDAGPIPVSSVPGNGIAAPSIPSGDYQTFVAYILYRTDSQEYVVYVPPTINDGTNLVLQHADDVLSPSAFVPSGIPDRSVVPGVAGPANTFDATIDLKLIGLPDTTTVATPTPSPSPSATPTPSPSATPTPTPSPTATPVSSTLPLYAQVNFITYNYLAQPSGFNGLHYYNSIGNGTDFVTLPTNEPGRTYTNQSFPDQQSTVMNQYGQTVTSATDQIIPNLQIASWTATIQSS